MNIPERKFHGASDQSFKFHTSQKFPQAPSTVTAKFSTPESASPGKYDSSSIPENLCGLHFYVR